MTRRSFQVSGIRDRYRSTAGVTLPGLSTLNVMALSTPHSAVLSALIFNALIIPALNPLALRGVRFRPTSAEDTFYRNLVVYGAGGLIARYRTDIIHLPLSIALAFPIANFDNGHGLGIEPDSRLSRALSRIRLSPTNQTAAFETQMIPMTPQVLRRTLKADPNTLTSITVSIATVSLAAQGIHLTLKAASTGRLIEDQRLEPCRINLLILCRCGRFVYFIKAC
jgi:hypothetical protein